MTELGRYYLAGRRDMRAEILVAIEARHKAASERAAGVCTDRRDAAAAEASALQALAREIEVML